MTVTVARPVTPVGVLAASLAALVDRAHTDGADPALLDGLREARDLAAGLDPYLRRCTTPESPGLARLAAATSAHDWGDLPVEQEMLSGHVEGALLQMLVCATGARRVLEIGLFSGYSALAMAEVLAPDGRVVACEVDGTVAGFARAHLDAAPSGDRVEIRIGPADDTLAGLAAEGQSFDLVFLDADKTGYQRYLDAVLDTGLLAPRGLLCVDNTLLQGRPWYTPAPTGRPDPAEAAGGQIARFNEVLAADPRVVQVLVPLRDGLTLARWAPGACAGRP